MPVGLASFMLAITGALSPASAATNWSFVNGYQGLCLKAPAGSAPYVGSCSGAYLWHWGSETNTWDGHSMRRLVNNTTGDCLTSPDVFDFNQVTMEPCGNGRSGQFWTADGDRIQNQNANYLATYPDGDLYSHAYVNATEYSWFDYRD